jgi:voltage-gated sodium channel
MAARCHRIAESASFQYMILGVIFANAALIGLETSPTLDARFGSWFDALGHIAQVIFTIEIAIRLTAHWPRLHRFFRGGWNSFDFAVVAIAFVPATGGLTNLARLARILRATRLVSALPDLRIIFETLLRSIPSIAHIIALIALFVYVYGILGFNLFATTDPSHWGTLGAALLTLFQVLTLEGWPDINNALADAHPWSWLFFASFIIVAVLIVTNLAVAVIIHSLEAAKQADAHRFDREVPGSPLARIAEIRAALLRLEEDIRVVGEEVRDPDRDPMS